MTDHQTPAPGQTTPPRRTRRYAIITAAVLAVGLTGAVATQAISDPGFGRGHWGHGPGFGPGMMGDRFGGPIDPDRAAQRADRMIRHLAVEIDATTEQQEKLRGIVKSAVQELVPMREKLRTVRQRARELLTQPKIDRAAIEAFRTEQVAQMDAASKRLTQALADAAEVLTPEQRVKVAERMAERRGRRGGRGHGWRGWHRGDQRQGPGGPDRPGRPDRG